MNTIPNLVSSVPHHSVNREPLPLQGNPAPGEQREQGDSHMASGTMRTLVLAGLAAVSATLAAVLTHAATNPQAYL